MRDRDSDTCRLHDGRDARAKDVVAFDTSLLTYWHSKVADTTYADCHSSNVALVQIVTTIALLVFAERGSGGVIGTSDVLTLALARVVIASEWVSFDLRRQHANATEYVLETIRRHAHATILCNALNLQLQLVALVEQDGGTRGGGKVVNTILARYSQELDCLKLGR